VRTAIALSAFAHALFWGVNALSVPDPIARPAENPITVDIVSADEIGEVPKAHTPETADFPEASAEPRVAAPPKSEIQSSDNAQHQSLQPPPRRDQPEQARQVKRSQTAALPAPEMKAEPALSGSAAPAAQDEPKPETKPEPEPKLPEFGSSWLDAALSSLPVTATRYDESQTPANLSQRDIATFKAQLQKCWTPPAGLADEAGLVTVLRISLKPNGMLAEDPIMLAASASSNGPALLQTAMRALRQCQPYGFLPSAKYNEWKLLDLSFSPTGLSTRPAFVSGF
jgi:hypothetical protein